MSLVLKVLQLFQLQLSSVSKHVLRGFFCLNLPGLIVTQKFHAGQPWIQKEQREKQETPHHSELPLQSEDTGMNSLSLSHNIPTTCLSVPAPLNNHLHLLLLLLLNSKTDVKMSETRKVQGAFLKSPQFDWSFLFSLGFLYFFFFFFFELCSKKRKAGDLLKARRVGQL